MGTEARRWFRAIDQTRGSGAAGLSVGFRAAARGLFPPLIGTVAVLFRRTVTPTPGAWVACGYDPDLDGAIKDHHPHVVNTTYEYSVCLMAQDGQVSRRFSPIASASYDATPALISGGLPSAVEWIVAVPSLGGKFSIRWLPREYSGGVPTDYQVFEGPNAANIDYGTVLGTVTYRDRGKVLTFLTAAFTEGTPHVFAVRGRNSAGVSRATDYVVGLPETTVLAPPSETHLTGGGTWSGQA